MMMGSEDTPGHSCPSLKHIRHLGTVASHFMRFLRQRAQAFVRGGILKITAVEDGTKLEVCVYEVGLGCQSAAACCIIYPDLGVLVRSSIASGGVLGSRLITLVLVALMIIFLIDQVIIELHVSNIHC